MVLYILADSRVFYKVRLFQINFDFITHLLIIEAKDRSAKTITLRHTVAVAEIVIWYLQTAMVAANPIIIEFTSNLI